MSNPDKYHPFPDETNLGPLQPPSIPVTDVSHETVYIEGEKTKPTITIKSPNINGYKTACHIVSCILCIVIFLPIFGTAGTYIMYGRAPDVGELFTVGFFVYLFLAVSLAFLFSVCALVAYSVLWLMKKCSTPGSPPAAVNV